MRLTDNTFAATITALQHAYLNWELPGESIITWKNVLSLSISDELLPRVITDWILSMTTPPKNPAEIIKHASKMVTDKCDSADTSAEILIDSARNAYYASDDFLTFADEYSNSFAAAMGTPAQEAYIIENIRKRSSSPSVLIFVYDDCKGALRDCFTGDAEHGVEFLRTQIKKNWNEKASNAAKEFLISGETEFMGLPGGNYGMLEG